jgi:hypothetical protein
MTFRHNVRDQVSQTGRYFKHHATVALYKYSKVNNWVIIIIRIWVIVYHNIQLYYVPV